MEVPDNSADNSAGGQFFAGSSWQGENSENDTVFLGGAMPQNSAANNMYGTAASQNGSSENDTVFMNNGAFGGYPQANHDAPGMAQQNYYGGAQNNSENSTVFFGASGNNGGVKYNAAPSGIPAVPTGSAANVPPVPPVQKPARQPKAKKAPKNSGSYEKSNMGITLKGKIALVIGVIVVAALAVYLVMDFTSAKAEDYISAADSCVSAGEYERALIEYDKALVEDPENTHAYMGKAEVYVILEQPEEAVKVLEEGFRKLNSQALYDRCAEIENTLVNK